MLDRSANDETQGAQRRMARDEGAFDVTEYLYARCTSCDGQLVPIAYGKLARGAPGLIAGGCLPQDEDLGCSTCDARTILEERWIAFHDVTSEVTAWRGYQSVDAVPSLRTADIVYTHPASTVSIDGDVVALAVTEMEAEAWLRACGWRLTRRDPKPGAGELWLASLVVQELARSAEDRDLGTAGPGSPSASAFD